MLDNAVVDNEYAFAPLKRRKLSNSSPSKKCDCTLLIDSAFLTMRQSDAAYQLGFASSTFSKRYYLYIYLFNNKSLFTARYHFTFTYIIRWRQALPDRKWPYRKHAQLVNSLKSLEEWKKKGHDVAVDIHKLQVEMQENIMSAVIQYNTKDRIMEVCEVEIAHVEDVDIICSNLQASS